ncbi:hypothetical protein SAMN05421736_111129 [Evansella caseinilytica]|uniref:Uncharacterized protein n=1 Tax=Evansella caseinilytica TaxID=1503961 RepID=A0A1H3SNZ3_9BACI|nr:hypothetical protein [Evansella caseinilytica]SDZ39261.1 hypothetical protein SAMN05421736_111129 [Evansella caseinilytica]
MSKRIYLFIALTIFLIAGCSNEEAENEELKEVVIEIPYQEYNHPVILGDEMFINVNSDPTKIFDVDTLIQYNIATGEEKVLYESEYEEAAMQKTEVNEDWLVWVDSSVDGYYEKILAMDFSNGEVQTLAETNPEYLTIFSPQLYNNYVAWTELNEEMQVEVKLHNLETNETISVGNIDEYSLYTAFVHLDDNKLLWTDSENENGYYYLYDLESKNTEKYEAPKRYPGYAKHSNGKIFAIHFENNDWTAQDFGYLDLTTNEYHSLEHGQYISFFDTANDKLAITDDNNDFYFYEFQNDELVPIEVTITEEINPGFIFFDNEGHLIIYADDVDDEITSNSRVGVIYP